MYRPPRSLCLYVCPFLCLCVLLCVPLSVSVRSGVCVPVCVSLCLCVLLFVRSCVCVSLSLCVCPFLCLYVWRELPHVTEKETEAKRTVFSIHSLFIHKLTQKEKWKENNRKEISQ